VIDLRGLSSLQVLAERLGLIRWSVLQGGDPARVAGDPSGIRALAGGHRANAGRLTAAARLGREQVSGLAGGSWHGEASESFVRYWSELEDRLDRLASGHERMADALDWIAEDGERLNREAVTLVDRTRAWLGAAEGAVSALDLAAAASLLEAGMTLVDRWERLLRDLEAFAQGIGGRVAVSLHFTPRPVVIRPIAPQPQPPIDPGPGADGSGMSRRDRIRPGSWRPPPHPLRRPLARGAGIPRVPVARPPRPARKPAPGSSPPARPGVSNPPGRGGPVRGPRRRPRVGTAPIHFPTVGRPYPTPPHAKHPALAPLPSPVDVYVFQTVTMVVLGVQKLRRVFERLRGNRSGNVKSGGVSRARRR
jgi:uncharacterized protein YukE